MNNKKEEEQASEDKKMRFSGNRQPKRTFGNKKAMGIAIALVVASCYFSGFLSFEGESQAQSQKQSSISFIFQRQNQPEEMSFFRKVSSTIQKVFKQDGENPPETPENNPPTDPSPSDPENTPPTDPTPSDPEGTPPTPADPENPTPTDPENPTPTDPENPSPTDPENPPPSDPENPTPSDPENPSPTDPETPPPSDPENPPSPPGPTSEPGPSDVPKFSLVAKFVTAHFAPVRKCNVTVTIQEKDYFANPDQNGIIRLADSLQSPVDSSDIETQIVIKTGIDPNSITNTITYNLTQTPDNPLLYSFSTQFFFKPVNPLPTNVIGKVVSESGLPVDDAQLLVTYDYPVFQDAVTTRTDVNGTFDAKADLDQLIPIFGNILITKEGYSDFDLRRDTEYKDGFFLVNHLEFKFDTDLVLRSSVPQITLSGKVVNRRGVGIKNVKISVSCVNEQDTSKTETIDVPPTDGEGQFYVSKRSTFDMAQNIKCTVIATPNDPSFKPVSVSVELLKKNNYKSDPLVIVISTDSIKGKILGKVISGEDNQPLQGVIISYNITSPDRVDVLPVKTTSTGEFLLPVNAFISEEYSGQLIVDAAAFQVVKIPVQLNTKNSYIENVGVIKLTYKPQPIDLNITAQVVDKILKVPLENIPFSLKLNKNGGNSEQEQPIELTTDNQGKLQYSKSISNTDDYQMELISSNNTDFEDFKLSKDFNPKQGFDGNLGVITLTRKQIKGTINGTITDTENDSKVPNATVVIITDVNLPDQPTQKCLSNDEGIFDCKLLAESGVIYNSTLGISLPDGRHGVFPAGQLSPENTYEILNLDIQLAFEVTLTQSSISGTVVDNSTNLPFKVPSYYSITSITPEIPSEVDHLNVKQQTDLPTGQFNIILNNATVGVNYEINITFSAEGITNTVDKSFQLNIQNNYTLKNQLIQLGNDNTTSKDEQIIQLSGVVKSKLYYPIEGATVVLFLNDQKSSNNDTENIVSNEDSQVQKVITKSDKQGLFSLQLPGPKSNTSSISAALSVTHDGYIPYEDTNLQFSQSNNFTITKYQVLLSSLEVTSQLSGKVVDERSLPVPLAALQLELLDSSSNPTTTFPVKSLTDQQGQFYFPLNITYDDIFTAKLTVNSLYFFQSIEEYKLNKDNNYTVNDAVVNLSRKTADLVFSGVVLNSLSKPITCESIRLNFDQQSNSYGAKDAELENTTGEFLMEQSILMGYVYTATGVFTANNYSPSRYPLEFTPQNNYQQTHVEIFMLHELVNSTVSGVVLEDNTKNPLKDAQVIISFQQVEFQNYTASGYTNAQGEFQITLQVQNFYSYTISAEGKLPLYTSQKVENLELSSANQYTLQGVTLILTKASESNKIIGYIKGHTISSEGDNLPNSQVTGYLEESPEKIFKTISDNQGEFIISKLSFVQGNTYTMHLTLTPKDQNYLPSNQTVQFSPDEYSYDHLDLVAQRNKTTYKITGKLFDQDTNAPIKSAFIVVSFINQFDANNADTSSDENGSFTVTGSCAKGIDLPGQFTITVMNYNPIRPKFILPGTTDVLSVEYKMKACPNKVKIYPLDNKNLLTLRSMVYEITKCTLFPHKYLAFVKVSLYLEDHSQENGGILYATTVTDQHGEFLIKIPRSYFVELSMYLLFERSGYNPVKVFQRVMPSDPYLEMGGIQMTNQKGISDCTKKQRKIQNKFEHKG